VPLLRNCEDLHEEQQAVQPFAQEFEGFHHLALHRCPRDCQFLCHFVVGAMLEAAFLKDFTSFGRQVGQGVLVAVKQVVGQ
jgi:hypothetical protein